jgi:hypothetical protein
VIAGRICATLDAALVGQAALALQEQLHALAATLLALRSGIARHQVLTSSGVCACMGGEVST